MAEYRGTGPNHNYFGDRPMPISGKFKHERERLATEMTMEEREWREKWCKDQELAPDEPKWIPDIDRALMNPIQRLYKTPLDWIFYKKFEPVIGPHTAYVLRQVIPKGLLFYMTCLSIWYVFKYRESTWERSTGWTHRWAKPEMFPGDPDWPNPIRVPHHMHASKGFYERKSFLDVKMDSTSSRTTKG